MYFMISLQKQSINSAPFVTNGIFRIQKPYLQFKMWLPFHRSSANRASTPRDNNVTSKPRHNTDSYECGAGKNTSIAS